MGASITAINVAAALSVPEDKVLELRPTLLSPEHLDFIGLVRAGEQHKFVPNAVVLHDEQPFIYIIDDQKTSSVSERELQDSIRFLGLRADAPYAAVVRPGIVQVYALSNIRNDQPPLFEVNQLEPGILARLMTGDVLVNSKSGVNFGAHELMLELLNSVTDHLVHAKGIDPSEVLALVGRALFMRFLGDRGIIPEVSPLPDVDKIQDCFSTAKSAFAACRWLDKTFNGDLLELPDKGSIEYFQCLDSRTAVLNDLTAIMHGDRPLGKGVYQTQFSWGDLHFSYLPVGLLSQVYEVFSHRFDKRAAKRDSVYYTPHYIAENLINHAFKSLGTDAYKSRVLDPASGGGVFLLSAFRRLVKENWQATGVQPNTRVIRNILNNQLVGFDINPAARQLTALAIYLTALELDPEAEKLKDLVFTPLQDAVLIAAEKWDKYHPELNLGSLSPESLESYEGKFDLVIGNPPWTATKNSIRRDVLNSIVATHMTERGLEAVPNPDGVPDLPFVWASTRLAKPNGILAFALHGRLLTKISSIGHAARVSLFQGIEVNYILNGMELRNTFVWPNMSAHFCLLVARNKRAHKGSQFHAVTPVEDPALNRVGRIRVDSKDAWTSDVAMIEKTSHLFKTLAKGNALDIELIERIENLYPKSIADYLKDLNIPATHGYQTKQVDVPGVDSAFLYGMKNMPKPQDANWYIAPVDTFSDFQFQRVHRLREQENYDAPLVLLRESPSSKDNCPMAILTFQNVAYNRSYIGYSCKKSPEPELLAVYLSTLFNSRLFLYFTLMTSSKMGCERSTLQKVEAEMFPFCPLNELSEELKNQLVLIKEAFLTSSDDVENLVETFIRKLYHLRVGDVNLINDRLSLGLPYKAIRTNAVKAVDKKIIERFKQILQTTLLPFDMSDTPLCIEILDVGVFSPWVFIRLGEQEKSEIPSSEHLMTTIGMGDFLDASLVEIPFKDSLYLGILNQRRYWSSTSARTLALDLIKRGHPVLNRGYK
ncbi:MULTISPECIES: N-6 DNA methylase [Photorhabdus]|uniref:N-6 DNA methylase n=1 Tax=Photorhabdus TaxID=29487 RepID=UPI000DCE68AC|nr:MULTISPECIES: N-6 DNA methylase [Photorhabdus]MCT8342277.1 N-6 DNA methylase [Photorhabdus kleinii]RAW98485.1 SAM-dependent methyltransferase [Photorhabdus sp. S10-54]RAW98599.1 SAM-dependent methyltransferase [Photorhabdus sp. S9-53]RAX02800.1 SAM-dependent methyltransferase [Photorhabdus sp. S8-52]